MNMTGQTMTAVFAKVADAVAFVKHLETGSGYTTGGPAAWHYAEGSLSRKGRTVTWTCSLDREGMYLLDLLETVGAFGSPPVGPKATLNGHRAPVSY